MGLQGDCLEREQHQMKKDLAKVKCMLRQWPKVIMCRMHTSIRNKFHSLGARTQIPSGDMLNTL